MVVELSIILGLIVIYILAIRSKNERIKELDKEGNELFKQNMLRDEIIRKANILNVPPKDLKDE